MNITDSLTKVASELYAATMANRERLVTAWIAETGIPPSEAVLVEQRTIGDGKVTTRVWVERREVATTPAIRLVEPCGHTTASRCSCWRDLP